MESENLILIILFGLVLLAGCASTQQPPAGQEPEACKDLCGDGICQEIVCMALGCPCPESVESCPADCAVMCGKEGTTDLMGFEEALSIAESSACVEEGGLKGTRFCNPNTGTWWFDIDVEKPGCAPACVVDVETSTAQINWRCTGAIPS